MKTAKITNLKEFSVADVDPGLIEAKLWNIRRFNGHPGALSVGQHRVLVTDLAMTGHESDEVIEWAYRHDDHEGIIGDIIGPVERIIRERTDVLDLLKTHLDIRICEHHGIYNPSRFTRNRVHFYDKLAESLEWQFGLNFEDAGFHPAWPVWLDRTRAYDMFAKAREMTRDQDPYAARFNRETL